MNFEVHPYSIAELIKIISDNSLANVDVIKSKHHSIYFEEYFSHLDTKTIVVEHDYIDKDYLDDFSSYYVRCFDDYERKCTRLHFFSNAFDEDKFAKLLESEESILSAEILSKSYLGFIVVKKLPNTVIGRSCLKTYNDDHHRNFPIIRPYNANLYGIDLSVESIPFQEQDSVVAACATSALWSIFHCTGLMFHHPIPSPALITKKASEYLPTGTLDARIFPNKGLSIEQMAYAVRDVSLEPYLVNPNEQFILQSTVYAYAHSKIPSLLGISLYNTSTKEYIGRHAVAVTGYHVDDSYVTTVPDSAVHLKSFRVSKFYVHDDQVGPFARMIFDNNIFTFNIGGVSFDDYSLQTFWSDINRQVGNIRAIPSILLIPLYHKIRIPFASILNYIIFFNTFIEFLRQNNFLSITNFLEWDIYLTSINEFKSEIFLDKKLVGSGLSFILASPLPHYMWRATATNNNQLVLDILFDATDIEQGDILLNIIEYDKTITASIRQYARFPLASDDYLNSPAKEIIKWFRDN